MTKALTSLVLLSSLACAFASDRCGEAPSGIKYELFPADLPQPAKYLIRLDSENAVSRVYAASPSYSSSKPRRTFVTLNHAKQWQLTDSILPNINALSSDAVNVLEAFRSSVAYKVHVDKLWRSDDNGLHWVTIKYQISGMSPETFAAATGKSDHARCRLSLAGVESADTVFAAIAVEVMKQPDYRYIERTIGLNQLYISRDAGNSWTVFQDNMAKRSPIGIDQRNPQRIIAESVNGPIISRNSGSTWAPVGGQQELAGTAQVKGFPDSEAEIDDSHRNASETRAMQVGLRNSREWRKLNPYQFLFDPQNSDVIYIVANKGLFKSEDDGLHWKRLPVGGPFSNHLDMVNSVIVDKGVLLVGTARGIYESPDGGCHFRVSFK